MSNLLHYPKHSKSNFQFYDLDCLLFHKTCKNLSLFKFFSILATNIVEILRMDFQNFSPLGETIDEWILTNHHHK
jgi:hypothetical protein